MNFFKSSAHCITASVSMFLHVVQLVSTFHDIVYCTMSTVSTCFSKDALKTLSAHYKTCE